MISSFEQLAVPVSVISHEAPSVIVIMAVSQPLRTHLVHEAADDAVGVPTLHEPEIAVDA